jgi:uncharacterized protein YjbJ (UPF0337 family)
MSNGNTTKRMTGKASELAGVVEKGVGQLIGNEHLTHDGETRIREGKAQQAVAKAAERAHGATEEVVGAIKGGVGKATGHTTMADEGAAEARKGKAKKNANK